MFKVGQRVWDSYNKCLVTIVDIKISEIGIPYSWEIKDDNGIIYRVDLFQIKYLHQTADDMLTVLGYRIIQENDALMVYEHEKMNDSCLMSSSILHFYHQHNAHYSSSAITPQLHLAIHQKLIELGWIE